MVSPAKSRSTNSLRGYARVRCSRTVIGCISTWITQPVQAKDVDRRRRCGSHAARGSRQPPQQHQRGHWHDGREKRQHSTQHSRWVRLSRKHTQVMMGVKIGSGHGTNSRVRRVTVLPTLG